ncbi:hypothetical protein GNI_057980 [Gregarina niphandrodes]|uniref:Uncharacterized protein n=1 Tax=Gregarina niphandrodes TaxID=110365 RepID=A0A023B8L2_GRENI|nr:hypothetical protein GNI_057980 [Gregarina niphandrodes]EZG69410.1 hypothetical protein GNI_057980 [Gregarina niphandrodes]|eukprot:XP_011130011.1 hypothetical protein GNI_057980 [Gregarina niphandrodes]
MGTCCSTTANEELTELKTGNKPIPAIHQQKSSSATSFPAVESTVAVSDAGIKEFAAQARGGVDVVIMLSNGLGLEARMSLDGSRVVFSRGPKLTKSIPLSHVVDVMWDPRDYKRIKTDAKLNDHCAALLLNDKTCIVIYFDSRTQRDVFVAVAQQVLRRSSH